MTSVAYDPDLDPVLEALEQRVRQHADRGDATLAAEQSAIRDLVTQLAVRNSTLEARVTALEESVAGPAPLTGPRIQWDPATIDTVRAKVAEGAQPWAGQWARVAGLSTSVGTLPVAVTTETEKQTVTIAAQRALAAGLRWQVTGEQRHFDDAARIVLAVCATVGRNGVNTAFPFTAPGNVIKLGAGFIIPNLVKAAELLGDNWSGRPVVAQWLRDQCLQGLTAQLGEVRTGQRRGDSVLLDHTSGPNWWASFFEARMCIAVFLRDDQAIANTVEYGRMRVPQMVYLPSDGPAPVRADFNVHQTDDGLARYWGFDSAVKARYVPGLWAETGRDLSHACMGWGALFQGMDIAYDNRVDLFAEWADRLVPMLELQAGWMLSYIDRRDAHLRSAGIDPAKATLTQLAGAYAALEPPKLGGSGYWTPPAGYGAPDWAQLNMGTFDGPSNTARSSRFMLAGGAVNYGWELAHRHYIGRLARSLPNLAELVRRSRIPTPGISPSSATAPIPSWPQREANTLCWDSLMTA